MGTGGKNYGLDDWDYVTKRYTGLRNWRVVLNTVMSMQVQ